MKDKIRIILTSIFIVGSIVLFARQFYLVSINTKANTERITKLNNHYVDTKSQIKLLKLENKSLEIKSITTNVQHQQDLLKKMTNNSLEITKLQWAKTNDEDELRSNISNYFPNQETPGFANGMVIMNYYIGAACIEMIILGAILWLIYKFIETHND